MNSFAGMRILALVRDGDYAHAGEEEAIELAMEPIAKRADQVIFDAGCGRGGTASYLHRNGWGTVVGFDIEPASIETARKTYPGIAFHLCDVCDVDRTIGIKADVLCLFNAYYCFPDQPRSLRALRKVSKQGARMVIFDHVNRGNYDSSTLLDAGKPFLPNPLDLSQLPRVLETSGWKVDAIDLAHDSYVRWYGNLVARIEAKRSDIIALAGSAGFDHVLFLYRGLLEAALRQDLGAAVIRATAIE